MSLVSQAWFDWYFDLNHHHNKNIIIIQIKILVFKYANHIF